ncbi:MAG: DUF4412 domain-containing protein [Bacteroidales bacterium]
MKKGIVSFTRCLCVLMILIIMSGSVAANEFIGKFIIALEEEISEGNIFVSGQKYCLELEQYGEKGKVIVDTEKGTTNIINYAEKQYRIIPSDDMISLMNNPFQSYQYILSRGEEACNDTKLLQGYACEICQIIVSDTPVMTKWHAKKLDFPIKIVQHGQQERVIEIVDIEEKAVDASVFTIPEGFTKWIDPDSLPGKRPTWAGEIENAPVLMPPFEEKVGTGDIIRVKIQTGKSLAVKATGIPDNGAVARVIPFQGNNPIKNEEKYSNLAKKGVICKRNHEMSHEADEFIIRIYEGDLIIVAKSIDMFEAKASASEEIRYPIKGDEHITTRFINLTEEASEATFFYSQNGQIIEDDVPLKYRTITLENPWDVETPTWVAQGDELVLKVNKGKMQIKLGQFDPFEF